MTEFYTVAEVYEQHELVLQAGKYCRRAAVIKKLNAIGRRVLIK